jgi:hypothetical protein
MDTKINNIKQTQRPQLNTNKSKIGLQQDKYKKYLNFKC